MRLGYFFVTRWSGGGHPSDLSFYYYVIFIVRTCFRTMENLDNVMKIEVVDDSSNITVKDEVDDDNEFRPKN